MLGRKRVRRRRKGALYLSEHVVLTILSKREAGNNGVRIQEDHGRELTKDVIFFAYHQIMATLRPIVNFGFGTVCPFLYGDDKSGPCFL